MTTETTHRDDNGRLHNIDGPAIKRKDGGVFKLQWEDDGGVGVDHEPQYEFWIHGEFICYSYNHWEKFIKFCALPDDEQVALKLLQD